MLPGLSSSRGAPLSPEPADTAAAAAALERPSRDDIYGAIAACTSADASVPPPGAAQLLGRSVQDVAAEHDDLVVALVAGLCRCMEEGEPPAGGPASAPAAASSYRFMKAMLLTSQLLQQRGASAFYKIATQRLLPLVQQHLSALEAAPPDQDTAAAAEGGVPRSNVLQTGKRLLAMLETGLSSSLNTGEFHVKARSRRASDIYLSPGQTVRWRFELAKHDIGLEIISEVISGAGKPTAQQQVRNALSIVYILPPITSHQRRVQCMEYQLSVLEIWRCVQYLRIVYFTIY